MDPTPRSFIPQPSSPPKLPSSSLCDESKTKSNESHPLSKPRKGLSSKFYEDYLKEDQSAKNKVLKLNSMQMNKINDIAAEQLDFHYKEQLYAKHHISDLNITNNSEIESILKAASQRKIGKQIDSRWKRQQKLVPTIWSIYPKDILVPSYVRTPTIYIPPKLKKGLQSSIEFKRDENLKLEQNLLSGGSINI